MKFVKSPALPGFLFFAAVSLPLRRAKFLPSVFSRTQQVCAARQVLSMQAQEAQPPCQMTLLEKCISAICRIGVDAGLPFVDEQKKTRLRSHLSA